MSENHQSSPCRWLPCVTAFLLWMASPSLHANEKSLYLSIEPLDGAKQKIAVTHGLKLVHMSSESDDANSIIIDLEEEQLQIPIATIGKISHVFETDELTRLPAKEADTVIVKIEDGTATIFNSPNDRLDIAVTDLLGRTLFKNRTDDALVSVPLNRYGSNAIILTVNGQSYKCILK